MANLQWNMPPRDSLMRLLLLLGTVEALLKLFGRPVPTIEVCERSYCNSVCRRDITMIMVYLGGYAYRLCKVPTGGISKVTEQCFRDGHLSFAGDDTWIFKRESRRVTGLQWRKQRAVRTREGTTPKGSQWAQIDIPEPRASRQEKPFWVFRDFVQVPATLESGRYVLSFRWDSQNTPQVWNSCANINIV